MRVLVTGMGGHLGTRVAQFLEARDDVEAVAGFDFVPPRRRLQRATFKRIDPRDRDRLVAFVLDFAPTAVAHFGVYEPSARMGNRSAAVEHRRVHGQRARRGGPRPARSIGSSCAAGSRSTGAGTGDPRSRTSTRRSVPPRRTAGSVSTSRRTRPGWPAVTTSPSRRLRLAPVSGSRAPSPIGRLLRLPAVPVPLLADPPFQLLHTDDAARAMLEALVRGADGAFNVVGPGAASPWQAVRLGNRIPVPFVGPGMVGSPR